MNTFNEHEMAIISASLLEATRAQLKKALGTPGDKMKVAHHLGFANDATAVYRKIANGSENPSEMNGYMDDVLAKWARVREVEVQ